MTICGPVVLPDFSFTAAPRRTQRTAESSPTTNYKLQTTNYKLQTVFRRVAAPLRDTDNNPHIRTLAISTFFTFDV
jgi:hypothetical protein